MREVRSCLALANVDNTDRATGEYAPVVVEIEDDGTQRF